MDDILDDFRDKNENEEENDWRNYLGEQADYYIPIWKKIQAGHNIIFNAYAFFLGMFWMLHRKMYRVAIIVGIISTFQIIVEELLRTNWGMTENEFTPISLIISLIWWVVLGLYGNYFFYHDAQKKITAAKNSTIENYDVKLQEVGGTSALSVIVGIVIYFAIIAFAMVIVDMYNSIL